MHTVSDSQCVCHESQDCRGNDYHRSRRKLNEGTTIVVVLLVASTLPILDIKRPVLEHSVMANDGKVVVATRTGSVLLVVVLVLLAVITNVAVRRFSRRGAAATTIRAGIGLDVGGTGIRLVLARTDRQGRREWQQAQAKDRNRRGQI